MGIGMKDVEYLSAKGYLDNPSAKMLDIGSQCLLGITPPSVHGFTAKHGCAVSQEVLDKEALRISYFSTPRPGERTTYLSELIDLTAMEYRSFDICPALKTEIFDLNSESVRDVDKGTFDLVLNCGTTEHVINQMNCLRVMHDAATIGGIMLHQLPSTGYLGHGYFCYHEEFFRDLAKSNEYEVEDLWYTPVGYSQPDPASIDLRDHSNPVVPRSAQSYASMNVPNHNINVVLRKTTERPFALALELATSHAAVADLPVYVVEKIVEKTIQVASIEDNYRHVSARVLLGELQRRAKLRLGLGK
jgi:hypothetical protein